MISHREAKRLVNERLRAEGRVEVASRASRDQRYGVWVVSFNDPARPGEWLCGDGPYVVTDDGDVHGLGSAPGELELLMMDLGWMPGAPRPATDTDSEALALMADMDPDEAEGLAAWAQARRQERGEDA